MSKKNDVQNTEVVTQSPLFTVEQLTALVTKSAQIRFLDSLGVTKGQIAKILTGLWYPEGNKKVLFQHVRNVLITPIKGQAK